jgi:hypothetical protein
LGRLDVHRAVTARAHPRELAGEAVVVAAFVAAHETFYTAVDEQAAGTALEAVADRWQTRYPAIVNLWRAHWAEFVPFLAFPPEIRRVIYTTNLIESINARLRKVTRNPGQFPSEQAALKVLYLAVRNLEEYLRPNVGPEARAGNKRSKPSPLLRGTHPHTMTTYTDRRTLPNAHLAGGE